MNSNRKACVRFFFLNVAIMMSNLAKNLFYIIKCKCFYIIMFGHLKMVGRTTQIQWSNKIQRLVMNCSSLTIKNYLLQFFANVIYMAFI